MISVKSKFGEDIRRFCVDKDTTLAQLKDLLVQVYQKLPANCFLEYSVKGSQSVSLTQLQSDEDLQKAIEVSTNISTPLIYINVKPTVDARPKQVRNISRTSSSFDILNEFAELLQNFVSMSLSTKSEIQDTGDTEEATQQLCEQLSTLAIQEIPVKREFVREYNLAKGNSNEPASDRERRAAFKKLVGAPSPYVQVTASGINPKEQTEQTEKKVPVKKKRPSFRKSCPSCEEPMGKEDGEWVCNNFAC